MRQLNLLGLCGVLSGLALAGPAQAEDWVGKDIILKKLDTRIGHTENGKQVYLAKLTNISRAASMATINGPVNVRTFALVNA